MKKFTFFLTISLLPITSHAMVVFDPTMFGKQLEQIKQMQQQLSYMDSQVKKIGEISELEGKSKDILNTHTGILTDQKTVMKSELEAVTGGRPLVVPYDSSHYLGNDWANISEISSSIEKIKTNEFNHGNHDLDYLPQAERAAIQQQETNAATQKALSDFNFKQASDRMATLQSLTDKISTTSDIKAAADLHARIQTEQSLLQNESTKLMNLAQQQQAQDKIDEQKAKEQAIKLSGSKDSAIPDLPKFSKGEDS